MKGGRPRNRLRSVGIGLSVLLLLFELVGQLFTAPAAHAQQSYAQICPQVTGFVVPISVTTAFASPYRKNDGTSLTGTSHDVGTKITARFGNPITTELTKGDAEVYRAGSASDSWSRVGTSTLTKASDGSWIGEYVGNLPDGAYRLFVLVKIQGQNPISGREEVVARGCSQAQSVTKGQSERDKFCAGNEAAARIGFSAKLETVTPGNAAQNRPATFDIELRLQKGLRNATQPRLHFKRSFESSTHVFTTLKEDVPLGGTTDVPSSNLKAWKPRVTDAPPEKPGPYRYHAFAEITVNGQRYTTCNPSPAFHRWGTAVSEDITLSRDEAVKWFSDSNNNLGINVPTEQGRKPQILNITPNDETGRPPLFFQLQAIIPSGQDPTYDIIGIVASGIGGGLVGGGASAVGSAALKGLTELIRVSTTHGEAELTFFRIYRNDPGDAEKRYRNVFFVLTDENLNGRVLYYPVNDDGTYGTGESLKEWGVTEESWLDLYGKIYNQPVTAGVNECTGSEVVKIGPVGDDKKAEEEKVNRDYGGVVDLKQSCINTFSYGWPAWWGVIAKQPKIDLGGACGFGGFLSLFKEGIGTLVAKVIGCLAASLFEGVTNAIKPILCEAASRSMIIAPPVRAQDDGPSAPAQDFCQTLRQDSPFESSSLPLTAPRYSVVKQPSPTVASFFVGTAHAQNFGGANSYESQLKDPDSVIVRIWSYSRSLVNIIVILALLTIAFANIFHFNLNTYTAKKALPGLVIGVVAANGSLLIVRFLADVAQAASQLALELAGSPSIPQLIALDFPKAIGEGVVIGLIGGTVAATAGAFFTGGLSLLGWTLLLVILAIYYAFLVIAFIIAFVKRVVILYFLAMLAPLAFVAYGLPQFQKYFYQWWDHFLRQLFVFPVIIFGMAATVMLAQQLNIGDYAQALNPTNFISGLVSIILVLSAATLVLKLPKIVTKGALDVASTFKKVLGAAPRMVGATAGANSWVADKRAGALTKKYGEAMKSGNIKLAAELRLKRMKASRFHDKLGGKLKTTRGYATIFSDPGKYIKEPWEERVKQAENDDKIAAVTKTNWPFNQSIPDYLKGKPAAFKAQVGFGKDELQEMTTPQQIFDWFGGGKKEKIYTALKGWIEKGKDDSEKIMRIGKIASTGSSGRWTGAVDVLKAAGISENDFTPEELAKVFAAYNKINQLANRMRGGGNATVVWGKIRDNLPYAGAGTADRPAQSGASAGPQNDEVARGASGRVAMFTDRQIQDRVEEIFNHGLELDPNLKDDIQDRLVRNLDVLGELEQMNPAETTYTSALEKTRQTLLEAIGSSAGIEADMLRQAIQQANDPAQLTRLTENLSIAAAARTEGGDFKKSIASIISQANQGTREFHQAHNELLGQTDLSRLEQAITGSLQAGGQDMADVLSRELGTSVNKMSTALGKQLNPDEQRRMFQQMAAQIQGTMVGPGQKTLRAVLQSSLQSLPKTFAKAVGVRTLQPAAMEVRLVGQAGTKSSSDIPPPTAPETPSN